MLIALLSDSHDNVVNTRAALELLRPFNPAAYLHAGDLVSASMLDLFAGLPLYFVLGNNEYDHASIRAAALSHGASFLDMFGDLTLDGIRICLMHGHEGLRMEQAIRSGDFRYLIHGHTHVRRDQRMGPTRVMNPGALHRAKKKSVALLDLSTDSLKFIDVDGS